MQAQLISPPTLYGNAQIGEIDAIAFVNSGGVSSAC
jgi:hypothetical protein